METPCVVVDYDIVMNNINRMAETIKNNNCKLRPHVKTHKTPEFAKMQIEAGAVGVTVAKISEAEVMAANGIHDIFIAYPVIGNSKVERIIDLMKKGNRIIVGVDSVVGARALSEAGVRNQLKVEIRLEIDTGFHRTGVAYENAVELAQQLVQLPGIQLTGIFTFKTLTYQGESTLNFELAGAEEGEMMSSLAQNLRLAGIDIQDVSVGSTPTAIPASGWDGITEVRPGSYIFNDMTTVNLDVCKVEDCAASVYVTVISNAVKDQIVVDAGSKVFAGDVSPGEYDLVGYGKIVNFDDLTLKNINEEHGMISTKNARVIPQIGDTLQIIPNHICTTVNLMDRVYLRKGKDLMEFKVQARGKVF